MTDFHIGVIFGAIVGFAIGFGVLAHVTRRCNCFPEDDK